MSNYEEVNKDDARAWLSDVQAQEGEVVYHCVLEAIQAHRRNPNPDMLAVRSVQGVYSFLKHNPSLLSGFGRFLPPSGGLAVDIFQQQPISLRTRGAKRAHAESMKDAMDEIEARKQRSEARKRRWQRRMEAADAPELSFASKPAAAPLRAL